MSSQPVTARLIAPRVSLASCIRAFIVRSTVGAELAPHERVNRFPATPACTLTWFLQGECERVPGGERLPRIVLAGPQTQPTCTYNPGPVHAFMMVVMPDALRAIGGIDAGAHVDVLSDAETVFDEDWRSLLGVVFQAADDADRVRRSGSTASGSSSNERTSAGPRRPLPLAGASLPPRAGRANCSATAAGGAG